MFWVIHINGYKVSYHPNGISYDEQTILNIDHPSHHPGFILSRMAQWN